MDQQREKVFDLEGFRVRLSLMNRVRFAYYVNATVFLEPGRHTCLIHPTTPRLLHQQRFTAFCDDHRSALEQRLDLVASYDVS